MKIKVSINNSIDKKASIKNGGLKAIGNHATREHGDIKNPSFDPEFSKYNEYHTYFDTKARLTDILQKYVDRHDNMKSMVKNPQRKIRTVWGNNGLVARRGKKLPFKFICIKFGNGKTRSDLLKLFAKYGYTYQDYANALNKSFREWHDWHAKKFPNLKIGYMYSNLDEVGAGAYGGDHIHIGEISDTKTKSGKISLSFDRGTRVAYGGKSNKGAWHRMQNAEDNALVRCATKVFQQYLGSDFSFQRVRHPTQSGGQAHKDFVATKRLEDRYTKQSKNTERKSYQSLARKTRSLIKQNAKLKSQVSHYSQGMLLKPAEAEQLEQSVESLVEQNTKLKSQSASRLATNQQLEQFIKKNLGVLIKNNNYWLPKLRILKQTNQNWYHEWNEVKSNLEILSGINRLSPRLRKALISLSNGQSNSLTEYLTELIDSEKSGSVGNKAPESQNQY